MKYSLILSVGFFLLGYCNGTAQTSTAQTSTAQTSTAQTSTAQTSTAQTGTAQTSTATPETSNEIKQVTFGPYEYEVRPDHEAFEIFHPRRAPKIGPLLLKEGDRLAICGDSITEQRMYSRIIETYLTACVPQFNITVRQYGWSGEKTDGFYRRMEQDCLTFEPTVATLVYGMNDCRYRPFDVTNGQWYEDYYTAIVRRFTQDNVGVIVGSPGCTGKVPHWVKSRHGTLDEQNLNLCSLRDIAIGVAEAEDVRFADIFWPMYQAQIFAPGQHGATDEKPYDVAGSDGVHPNWAGHVIMAWSLLRSMGLDGDIGTITVDLDNQTASATEGHTINSFADGVATITSTRYPFCARGDLDSDSSIRSGTTLVPFTEDLNRYVLKVNGKLRGRYTVKWGEQSKDFSAEELSGGIHLPVEFPENPFCEAFDRIDHAVAEKQAFETKQVKQVFHGVRGKDNFEKAVIETEVVRKPLAQAIADAVVPVTHKLTITSIK
ncbi:GDSL-like Lipase/Acylhydrolase [Planctomycetes bacterium CA13]|uniref:GDSL-like Lipase/Acylhydrolase n=1 Tax=Novipirellula herctigrandis TaxID=2527986 RepID=A0A5C5Z3V6_9BACT|nr:GDSL-like Lipase/Acylhydrolase [Planctomycetes bacterium CA13]